MKFLGIILDIRNFKMVEHNKEILAKTDNKKTIT